MSGSILIIGATSDMAAATARLYASRGWSLRLAGRDPARLAREADDLRARFDAEPQLLNLDVTRPAEVQAFLDGLTDLPDTVVCFVGDLGDPDRARADLGFAERVMTSNYVGPALILGALGERMAERGSGALVGVSSVAGDRGRASNYHYGSAKAGLTAFLSGLRNRLAGRGVRVVTLKPGFVRTRMTRDLRLPPVVTAEPAEAARAVWRAAEEGRGEVVYVRPVWRPIMMLIRAIPEPVFKRLKL